MDGVTLLTGLMIMVGLIGIVLPVLPGLLLIWAGVALWAVTSHDTAGWITLGLATALVAIGTAAKFLLPGRQLRSSGVPWTTIAVGTLLGVVGFFVIPVVGLFAGFVLGVFLAELARLDQRGAGATATAWESTKQALIAIGWSIAIELATGLLITAAWITALVVG